MFDGYYAGKRVLVTGHTGFKGGWLSLWLNQLGARVYGLGLEAPTNPNLHEIIAAGTFAEEVPCDVRDRNAIAATIRRVAPDVVFHLAAQPIVRRSYAEPIETFEVNALGTAHVLEAIRIAKLPCTVIVVTSDKCYENKEWPFSYRENDALGGHDIYSMSKAAAELVAAAWRKSFFGSTSELGCLATARAGNVIGGGDYAADRIIPDCVRSLIEGTAITVRNPAATRPWQHVLECLSGYLCLAAKLPFIPKDSPLYDAFNFGPGVGANRPVAELVEAFITVWPGKWTHPALTDQPHEAGSLNVSIDKAASLLRWRPAWNVEKAVKQTAAWYRQRHVEGNGEMREFTLRQIADYVSDARDQGIEWSLT